MSKIEDELEIEPSNFKCHKFDTGFGEIKISGHVIKMEKSIYLWVGDKNENTMNDFCLAMPTNYETQPIATKLFGPIADTTSMSIAKRLAKKFSIPIYVSFNLNVDNLSLPGIEKCLQTELGNIPDLIN
ncbi:proteasome assembly chaperone 4-like [Leptopilina heterotoma]|uniref:proteasome assembly chaperone 4-like n=1 Tax=Leptopilina heterotoma TaxID=63436 RepID=UPI001CA8CF66|nr:proteasome assembly chaperone 4-like [Leptopilina heterotoma]XP_043474935.1 proteasome assembly chaperone 4-like [Leptopilina heterotoma]